MDYVILDVVADAGGDVSPVVRSTETEYADGYKQVVFKGRNTAYDKITFAYSREYKHTEPVYALLRSALTTGRPFYYAFVEGMPRKLYVVSKDSLTHAHISGHKWSVTATFEEWSGLL